MNPWFFQVVAKLCAIYGVQTTVHACGYKVSNLKKYSDPS